MSDRLTLSDGSVLDVARYPLPDGLVDDGTPLNRSQLAAAFGVSVNAVTDWVSKGLPVMATGQNGVAYEFRLAHCWAWRQDRDDRSRAQKARGDQLAAQAALRFRNLDEDQAEDEAVLTADDLRKWSEAEYHRNRVAEQRRDLMRRDRVQAAFEDIFVTFGKALDNLPDFMEIEFGLSPDQVEAMQRRCDQTREDVRRKIEEATARGGDVLPIGGRQGELGV